MWSSYQKSIINMEDGHVGPYPPPKGDKTHAHASEQAHIHAKLLFFFFFFTLFPQDFMTNSPLLCRNIEDFPCKLRLCPRSCSLSNIHKCLSGFVIYFHHRNLRIFPLWCLQQQLIVLWPW